MPISIMGTNANTYKDEGGYEDLTFAIDKLRCIKAEINSTLEFLNDDTRKSGHNYPFTSFEFDYVEAKAFDSVSIDDIYDEDCKFHA